MKINKLLNGQMLVRNQEHLHFRIWASVFQGVLNTIKKNLSSKSETLKGRRLLQHTDFTLGIPFRKSF